MTKAAPLRASNFDLVGHTDQAGRSDGTQIMVSSTGHAYIGHPFSHGVSVVDVHDPRSPRPVGFLSTTPRTWSLSVQLHDELLLVTEELDFFCLSDAQAEHFARSTGPAGPGIQSAADVYGGRQEGFSAGLRIYDLADPAAPRPIGFCAVEGLGLHRAWWVGGRYVYASASLDGFSDHILLVIDIADPTRPAEVGRFWMPGQWLAGGETPMPDRRVALHHAIVAGDTAYSSWRDDGLALLDLAEPTRPRLRSQLNWSPPFGGNTHTSLPLPDRDLVIVADETSAQVGKEQQARTWVVDVRSKDHPVSIATLPMPADQDYAAKGGQFGPHNLWENRPGGWVSSEIVFATYQSAGVRAFDLSEQFQPREVGYFVPDSPATMVDPRPGIAPVTHSSDLYVSDDGLVYLIDYNAGLSILQYAPS